LSPREIVTAEFDRAIEELRGDGFRLETIFPADDPASAVMSRGDEVVRLSKPGAEPLPKGPPPFRPEFVLTRAAGDAGKARQLDQQPHASTRVQVTGVTGSQPFLQPKLAAGFFRCR
jgi:hypothetical protein